MNLSRIVLSFAFAMLWPIVSSAADYTMKAGRTDVSVYFIMDTTGNAPSGVQYIRNGAAAATLTAGSELAAMNSAHSDNQWKVYSPGGALEIVRYDLPDAVVAQGASSVVVYLVVAEQAAEETIRIDLVGYDPTASALAANVTQVSGDTAAADNLEDVFDEESGSGVAMALESLNVTNASGNAVTFASTGGNGNGLTIVGHGDGNGLLVNSGATGHGAELTGGEGVNDYGLRVVGESGAIFKGSLNGDGVSMVGGENGNGLELARGGSGSADLNLVNADITDNVITAAAIAANAIGDSEFNVAENLNANVTQFGGVNGTFSSGRPEIIIQDSGLTAAKIAGDAFTAAKFAADVTTEFQSGLATAAALDAVDNFVDTEVAAIKAKTDNLPTSPAAVGSAMTLAGGAITSGTFGSGAITASVVADAAIDRATFAADTGLQSIRSGTAQTDAGQMSTSIKLDASASATLDFYKHTYVYLTGGTGVGQYRLITGYNGSTKVATVTPAWATIPDGTSTFAVLPEGIANVEAWFGAPVVMPTVPGVPAVDVTHLLGQPLCD
jgi:hypothetical protein